MRQKKCRDMEINNHDTQIENNSTLVLLETLDQ
jgi:hypothetical protein